MSIGERLKALRKEKGYTQKQLGQIINKSSQVISNWERGYTTGITDSDIRALSKAFGVSADYLVDDEAKSNDTRLRHEPKMKAYYLDPEVAEIANKMKDDPNFRVLFDAARDLDKESIEEVKRFIEFQKSKER